MSSVDNRIIEMQFNNRRFEQNAKETMSTLDKLKEKLNFRDSTKELQDFQNASDSFNLSHISNAVDEIGNKFTLMGQIGVQAMQRLASAALNLGENLIKSISIDQISEGMSKYEQETNAVQTMYGALKPKGVKLEEIYETLEKLADYSDQTSYSYSQMTGTMSRFINAGMKLTDAETTLEGISNAAAMAGVGIHDTEIIYRNFADAIGKGSMTAGDWISIQAGHMDTTWLKDAFIEEAISRGLLDKSGRVLVKAEKRNKKGEITQEAVYKSAKTDFKDTLSAGWLTADVMRAVFGKYADRELEGYGKEAFPIAQNAKTFTDVLDAVKDAASSGWSKSFRLIFGDLEEAIEFFTPMADAIIGVVNDIDDFRNAILQGWKDSGGRGSMIETLKNLWGIFEDFRGMFGEGFAKTFNFAQGGTDSLATKFSLLTRTIQFATQGFKNWIEDTEHGGARMQKIQSIIEGFLSIFHIAWEILSRVRVFVHFVFDQLKPTFDAIIDLLGEVGADITGMNDDLTHKFYLVDFFLNLADAFKPITSRLPKVVKKIQEFYQKLKKFWNTNPRIVKWRKSVEDVINAFVKFIPNAIESLIEFGKKIVETVKNSDEWKKIEQNYNKYIKPWASRITVLARKFNEALTDFFNMDTSDEDTLWGKIKKRFSAFDKLGPWLQETWDKLKKDFPWLKDVEEWWTTDPVINEIKAWVTEIGTAIDTFLSADTSGETSLVGKIQKRFKAMWDQMGPWLEGKWAEYKEKWPFLQTIEDVLSGLFGWGKEGEEAAQAADEGAEQTVGFLQRVWQKIEEFVGNIDVGNLAKFALAIYGLVKLYQLVKDVADWVSLGQTIKEAIEGIATAIEDAHKTAEAKNMLTKAETLAAVAGSVWLMADAINKVAGLSWEQIGQGIATMVATMGAELGFMKLLQMINGDPSTEFGPIMGELAQGLTNLENMIGLCLSILSFGGYLQMVANIPWPNMQNGMAALFEFMTMETAFLGILKLFTMKDKNKDVLANLTNGVANSAMLITLSLNILTFGTYLNMVSGIPWDKMQQAMGALAEFMAAEAGFLGIMKLLTLKDKNKDIFANLTNAIGVSAELITLSLNMLSFGWYLNMVAGLSWDQIQNGLKAMGNALALEAGFIGILKMLTMNDKNKDIFANLTNAIGNSALLGSLSLNLLTLGNYLNQVAGLEWEQIKNGLKAMAGLFVGEGSMAVILTKFGGGIDTGVLTAGIGALAAGTSKLAESVEKLGNMSFIQLVKGLASLIVVIYILKKFVEAVNGLKNVKMSQMFSVVLVAGAMWLVADALAKLCQFDMPGIIAGVTGMMAVAIVLWGFMQGMQQVETIGIKKLLSTVVSAIVLAGLMVAFAFAVSMIKDVDALTIVAFGAAMLMVGTAMEGLSKAIKTLSGISIGAALKAVAVIGIAAVVIGGAIALIVSLVGNAIEGFGSNIAMVGSYLSLYSDTISTIDYDAVCNSIQMVKDLAEGFAYVGSLDYGNLEVFKTNLTRMGASLKLFGMNTAEVDMEKMTTTARGLRAMGGVLSTFPEVGDIGTSIANIGGAIKLYSDSVNGVSLDDAPDSTAIKQVFDTLKGAIPDDENLTEVAAYADEGKGNEMTNFAIGLENIATAVSSFSETAKDLDFTNMESAITALEAIASLNDHFGTTTVESIGAFGAFGTKVTEEKGNLSTFAEDIVTLGTSLEAFGDNISKVKTEDLTTGADVLEKIAGINDKLPAEGGLSQWLTGSVSLTRFAGQLKLLGEGAKGFNDAIHGGEHSFDPDSVAAAGEALIKIAGINAKLPKTGGISSWFTGDESLENFGSGLGHLGTGIAAFAEGFGDATITDEMVRAVTQLDRIANIQAKLGNANSWYSMDTLAGQLEQASGFLVQFNTNMTGVTWQSTEAFEHLLSFAVEQQAKLGNMNFSKNLKNIGSDIKGFFDEVWAFTKSGLFSEDASKIDKVTDAVTGIFTTLNDSFINANNDGSFTAAGESLLTMISDGFTDSNSVTKIENSVVTIVNKITAKVKSYTGKNQAFYNVGTWIPAGLADGILANQSAVVNAIIDVVNAGVQAGKDTAEIKSPSRVFAEMGMYMDYGLAKGLRDNVTVVSEAGKTVSENALTTVLEELKAITDLPLDQMEVNPTIRPVLDTSDISSRAGMIDNMLGGMRTIGFNTRQLEAQAQILGDAQGNDLTTITQQVTELRNTMTDMTEKMTHLQIVLNNGALVGALESDIDRALGARARRGERGG